MYHSMRGAAQSTHCSNQPLDAFLFSRADSEDLAKAQKIIENLEERLYIKREAIRRVENIDRALGDLNERLTEFVKQFSSRLAQADMTWKEQLKSSEDKVLTHINTGRKKGTMSIRSRSSMSQLSGDTPHRNAAAGDNTNLRSVKEKLGDLERQVAKIYEFLVNGHEQLATSRLPTAQQSIYGITEIANCYDIAKSNVSQTIAALRQLKEMPAVYRGQNSAGGIRSKEDIDVALNVLETFHEKLQKSTAEYTHNVEARHTPRCYIGASSSFTSTATLTSASVVPTSDNED